MLVKRTQRVRERHCIGTRNPATDDVPDGQSPGSAKRQDARVIDCILAYVNDNQFFICRKRDARCHGDARVVRRCRHRHDWTLDPRDLRRHDHNRSR